MIDNGRLIGWLNSSKLAIQNNNLYQCINSLIANVLEVSQSLTNNILTLTNLFNDLTKFRIVEIDTSGAPQTVDLSVQILAKRMVIIKDINGNASVNNITLSGTVEGVVDPVINTDYGIERLYRGENDGLIYRW